MERFDEEGNLRRCRVTPNRAEGILPVLQQLLEQDRGVEWAFLCHPAVRHVSKLKREGGFCGYRNIQMLSSYIVGVKSQGHDNLKDKIPSIFEIQDHIEMAWDLGINVQGRDETGGIRGTRKYIGTSEAQAMFCKLGIACDAQGFKPKRLRKDSPSGTPKPQKAHDLLFAHIEAYFTAGCTDYDPKIRCTTLPPIYFQHPGHSLTIIGIQRATDGAKSLIVFDPLYHDPPGIMRHVGHQFVHKDPSQALKLYRRGRAYLEKYHEFEVLKLCPPVGLRGEDEVAEEG
ncbi:putative Zinc finger with UFM1-specific peptidase domain protein [Glarea lozoyensis 74030]|uniref:Putative Zinc finger with UFM1-specific peptidase domain protein n=1 Tax=Glarea lozoyensis (strain ATCC 74030 / MF5533) TaxID=1104152 RepID=H0EIH3_GLAL7|nr:putative Zinc finger with UFM1-specific peptidase domain protein [Glarea lozoyensis 74030]